MKIWIVYASAGWGHRRAAEAIYEAANKVENEVKLLDILDYTPSLFKKIYSEGYTFLITYLSFLWNILYRITDIHIFAKIIKTIHSYFNRWVSKKLILYFKNEKPEAIFSTHFFLNSIIPFLKKIYPARFFSVITDLGVHTFWVEEYIDKYLVAFKYTREELISLGVNKNKILVTGIPVLKKFESDFSREILCKRFSLKKDIFTVLIVSGAIGLGPIIDIVNSLKDSFQLLVICGDNKKLYNQIKKINSGLIKVYRTVRNIDELMSVSDVIITKPGGLSIAEALIKRLPILLINPVSGQEEKNLKILLQYKLAILIKSPKKTKVLIEYLLKKGILANLKRNLSLFSYPGASERIYQCITQM